MDKQGNLRQQGEPGHVQFYEKNRVSQSVKIITVTQQQSTLTLCKDILCTYTTVHVKANTHVTITVHADAQPYDITCILEPYAHVTWLQTLPAQAVSVQTVSVQAPRNALSLSVIAQEHAHFTGYIQQASGTLHAELLMQEHKSHAQITVIHVQKDQAQSAITTRQHHYAPDTESHVTIRGMLCDQAQSHYEGKIVVEAQAHNSHAIQENKTLLLSDKTYAQAQPALEILTDKVSCKHGSAIGILDEDQLWHLMAQGIEEKSARYMLIQAFFADCLTKIKDTDFYQEVLACLQCSLR